MNQNQFIIWRAWIALPVCGLMLLFLYVFEVLRWLTDKIRDFFFHTAEGAYNWSRNASKP